MHVTLVYVSVKPQHVEDFIAATQLNHQGSTGELGNVRFDVLQVANDASCFVLYEAYTTADAAAAHKQTTHYLKWRDAVAPWMAKPREGVNYRGLFPVLNPQ